MVSTKNTFYSGFDVLTAKVSKDQSMIAYGPKAGTNSKIVIVAADDPLTAIKSITTGIEEIY